MMGAITGIVCLVIAIIIALVWLPALSATLNAMPIPSVSGLIAGLGDLAFRIALSKFASKKQNKHPSFFPSFQQ